MISLVMWVVFGLIVGWIAKAIHPGDDPVGCFPTIGIGIAGSFVGGLTNFMLGFSSSMVSSSGFMMSIFGSVLFLIAWRYYVLKIVPDEPKSFFSGR